jgi:hypothetical protein
VGTPWDRQWTLEAVQNNESLSDPVTVAAGHLLRLTDVLWSNETQDTGTLSILRDGEVVLQWGLGSNRNWAQAFRNGVELEAGVNLTVRLVCESPGDPTATGCDVSITLAGVDLPLEQG